MVSPLDGLRAAYGDKVAYAKGYAAGRPMYGRADDPQNRGRLTPCRSRRNGEKGRLGDTGRRIEQEPLPGVVKRRPSGIRLAFRAG